MTQPDAIVRAAQRLIAEPSHSVDSVDEIVLRDHDAYDDEDPRRVTFIPIGEVIGIAVKRKSEGVVADKDIVFVSTRAFAIALTSLGFVTVPGSGVAVVSRGMAAEYGYGRPLPPEKTS